MGQEPSQAPKRRTREQRLLLPSRVVRTRGQSLAHRETRVSATGLPHGRQNPELRAQSQTQKFRAGRALTWHSLEEPPVILLGTLRPVEKGKQARMLRGDAWDFQKESSRGNTSTQAPVSLSAHSGSGLWLVIVCPIAWKVTLSSEPREFASFHP